MDGSMQKRKRLALQKAQNVVSAVTAAAPKSRKSTKRRGSIGKKASRFQKRIAVFLCLAVFVAGMISTLGLPTDAMASINAESIGQVIDAGISKLQGIIGVDKSGNENKAPPGDAAAFVKKAGTTLHFFPVGNADATLIISKGKAFLVDAGNSGDAKTIKAYLEEKGIKSLEAVVATHPHADHIGGMASIIRAFKPKRIYMPNIAATTKTFENMLDAIEETGMELIIPKLGDSFTIGDVKYTVVGPVSNTDKNTNNHSIILRGVCGSVSFLLCGDAEKQEESSVVAEAKKLGITLSSNIIKVAHHGRKTSSIAEFVLAVSPKAAIIHCGERDGKDGPDAGVMKRFTDVGASVYRTDEKGMIIVGIDGKTFAVSTEK